MKKILYFDTLSGISGDMTIGALIDLLNEDEVNIFKDELKKLNLEDEYEIEINKKSKNGIMGTKFDVILKTEKPEYNIFNNNQEHDHDSHKEHSHHENRNLSDINKIIDDTSLSEKVKKLSKDIFMKVALAESKIHGKSLDEIHFHEVGAVDSIIDIIGTSILLEILNIDDVRCSAVHVGTGFTKCAHGIIPLPSPATLEILKDVPTYSYGIKSELVTPTGAGILKTIVTKFGDRPNMTILNVGYGLGTKNLEIANVLRVYIGQIEEEKEHITEKVILLETNIDDMIGEAYTYIFDKLFEMGALDVYTTPIGMKKNRPATTLSVLTTEKLCENIEKFIFLETSTFGIRKTKIDRISLNRKFDKINTNYGEVSVKLGFLGDDLIKISPEFSDINKIATEHNMSFINVYKHIMSVIEVNKDEFRR